MARGQTRGVAQQAAPFERSPRRTHRHSLARGRRRSIHRCPAGEGKLRLLAEREFARFGMIPAAVGTRVEKEFKLYEEEILPILERTPVTV